MGDSNSKDGKNSNLKGIGGILLTSVAVPIADKVIEKIADKIEERSTEETVTVPMLYTRIHLTLEQAVKSVEAVGLKAIPVEIHIQQINIKYKDCFENQVVDSEPKQNKKVRLGTGVRLIFVTKEVIAESQKLFDETRRTQIEVKERTKENFSVAVKKTKQGVAKIFKRDNKEKILGEDIPNE